MKDFISLYRIKGKGRYQNPLYLKFMQDCFASKHHPGKKTEYSHTSQSDLSDTSAIIANR